MGVQKRVLAAVYKALVEFRVRVDLTLLKTNFVLPSRTAVPNPNPSDVAKYTLEAYRATVPPAVGGILFLSGGLTELESTEFCNACNALDVPKPWPLVVSFGRALQGSCLKAWKGSPENVKAAQAAFAHRARMNTLAVNGKWTADAEKS